VKGEEDSLRRPSNRSATKGREWWRAWTSWATPFGSRAWAVVAAAQRHHPGGGVNQLKAGADALIDLVHRTGEGRQVGGQGGDGVGQLADSEHCEPLFARQPPFGGPASTPGWRLPARRTAGNGFRSRKPVPGWSMQKTNAIHGPGPQALGWQPQASGRLRGDPGRDWMKDCPPDRSRSTVPAHKPWLCKPRLRAASVEIAYCCFTQDAPSSTVISSRAISHGSFTSQTPVANRWFWAARTFFLSPGIISREPR